MPTATPRLRLGDRRYDLTHRCLVMGVVSGTPYPSSDQGATSALDRALRRAETLVAEGADILSLAGDAEPAGAVDAEELDRVLETVAALTARFDVPVCADTANAAVLTAACAAGAAIGNDITGFADPGYLPAAARCGASVVATHRPGPPGADPAPHDDEIVVTVARALAERAERALAAGLAADQIVLDPAVDRARTPGQSAVLLGETERLARLGHPLLLSAFDATFPGEPSRRTLAAGRATTLTAVAYGVAHGCRIVRVHDVAGTVRVVRLVERILEARTADGDPA